MHRRVPPTTYPAATVTRGARRYDGYIDVTSHDKYDQLVGQTEIFERRDEGTVPTATDNIVDDAQRCLKQADVPKCVRCPTWDVPKLVMCPTRSMRMWLGMPLPSEGMPSGVSEGHKQRKMLQGGEADFTYYRIP